VVANRNIQAVRPEMTVLDVSAKSGEGVEKFLDFLRSRRNAARVVAASQRAKVFAAPD
jgi:Ni2+-binding GTPase involved in maturation of urease and hydrogenase